MALDEDSKTCFNEVVNKGKNRKFIMMVQGQDILDMKVYKRGAFETYRSKIKSDRKEKKLPIGNVIVHGVISGKKKNLNFQLTRELYKKCGNELPVTNKKLKKFVRGATDSTIQFEPIFEIVDDFQLNIDPDDSPVAAEFLELQEDAFNACENFPKAAKAIGDLCLEIGKLLNKGEDEADETAGTKVKELKQLLEKVIAGEYAEEENSGQSTESDSAPVLSEKEQYEISLEAIRKRAEKCPNVEDLIRVNKKIKEITKVGSEEEDYSRALSLIRELETELNVLIGFHKVTIKFEEVNVDLSRTLTEKIEKTYEEIGQLVAQRKYDDAEPKLKKFYQRLKNINDEDKANDFKIAFKEVGALAKEKLVNYAGDSSHIQQKLKDIFEIGIMDRDYEKALSLIESLKEELEDGPIVTEFKKQTKRIEKLSNLHVSLKKSLNEQCTEISELLSKKDPKAVDRIEQLKQHLDDLAEDPNFIEFEKLTLRIEKLSNLSKELAENLNKQCSTISGLITDGKANQVGDKIKQLKQHLDDISDKKKAKEFKIAFKIAYEIAKEHLAEKTGDTGKIRMLLNYITEVGVNYKNYTKAFPAIKDLEKEMGDTPIADEFLELKPVADEWGSKYPQFKSRFDDRYEEIKELIERSEYKKARDKIKQFKQYSIDITDTKKEKKYEATFDIVFSITAKYLEKDPTRAAIIEPIVDECNELAEYNDYTEALSVIKRLEEAMGTSPVVGEFIELKNEVDRLSGMHSELKDEMSKRYQEIGDLIDKSEDKKARAKIQQFKQYLSDITDSEKEEEYNTVYKTVSSEAETLLKKDLGDSKINPLFVNAELKKCAELATKYKDYTAAIQALKELQSWLEVMAKDKAEVLPLINECILNIEGLREGSPIESVMSIVSQSETIIRKFDRHGSIEVSEKINILKEKLGTVKELMGDLLAVSKFDELKDEVDRLSKMYPELESRIRGRHKEISDLIDKRKYKDAGAKVKLLKQYLSDVTDTKKEKEYNTTYKTVSSGAQKLLKKDLGDSRINPLFVNTELEKCAELAKERNYTEAIRALEELQSQLGVMATNKAKVLRFINECIQDIEALGKKSSIGLVTSVINSSEEIIRKFNQHGSVEVTEMIETLKEKLVDAKNLRDKKTEELRKKSSKTVKKVLFGGEDTEAFKEFTRKLGDDTLLDLHDQFGGQKGLVAVKQIQEELVSEESQETPDKEDTSTSGSTAGKVVDETFHLLEFLGGMVTVGSRVGVGSSGGYGLGRLVGGIASVIFK